MAKRPYLIPFNGKDRLVQAGSLARARRHVINGEIAKVRDDIEKKVGPGRCANGSDVAAFVQGGGRIEAEGLYPVEPTGSILESLTAEKDDESTAESGHGGH